MGSEQVTKGLQFGLTIPRFALNGEVFDRTFVHAIVDSWANEYPIVLYGLRYIEACVPALIKMSTIVAPNRSLFPTFLMIGQVDIAAEKFEPMISNLRDQILKKLDCGWIMRHVGYSHDELIKHFRGIITTYEQSKFPEDNSLNLKAFEERATLN